MFGPAQELQARRARKQLGTMPNSSIILRENESFTPVTRTRNIRRRRDEIINL